MKSVPDVHILESGAKWRCLLFYDDNSPPFIITPRLSKSPLIFFFWSVMRRRSLRDLVH